MIAKVFKIALILTVVFLTWFSYFKPVPTASDADLTSNYKIQRLAEYSGEFRVLSTKRYSFGRDAEVSFLDLGLAWGKMANPEYTKSIDFNQRDRWLYFRYDEPLKIERRYLETHVANTHVIASSPMVAKQLKTIDLFPNSDFIRLLILINQRLKYSWERSLIKEGDMIYLYGDLVEVTASDGWIWRSSLSREDLGDGACEVMLVKQVKIISH